MQHSTLLKAASLLALMAAGSAASAQVMVSLDSPADMEASGSYVWAHTFTTYLNENGMEAEEYQTGALGGDAEVFDQVSQGLLEIGMSPLGITSSIDTLIYGLRLPYFFSGPEEIDAALYEGGMMDAINAGLEGSGVQVMAVDFVGSASGIFNTQQPITSMADMADLRMRALDESQIALFEAWGSNGTIVSWAEVPNALQTGVADGYLNPAFVPLMFGHTDFIKYFTPAEIAPSLRSVIMSEDWYNGLGDDERAIVDAAVLAANEANRAWMGTQDGVYAELEAAGVTISEMNEEDRAAFQEASSSTYLDIVSEEQLAQWQAAVGR